MSKKTTCQTAQDHIQKTIKRNLARPSAARTAAQSNGQGGEKRKGVIPAEKGRSNNRRKAVSRQERKWVILTDKELRKLRRTELLEMMIEGKQAVAAAEEKVAKVEAENRQLQETYERLRKKLDEKDEKIRGLKEELVSALDKKKILTEEAESVAEVTARLAAAVESAERAQALFEEALKNTGKKRTGAGDQP